MKRTANIIISAFVIISIFTSCGRSATGIEKTQAPSIAETRANKATATDEEIPIVAMDEAIDELREMLRFFLNPDIDFDINESNIAEKITGYLFNKSSGYRSLTDYYLPYYDNSAEVFGDRTEGTAAYREDDIKNIMFKTFGLEPSKESSQNILQYDEHTEKYIENYSFTKSIYQDTVFDSVKQNADKSYEFTVRSKEFFEEGMGYTGIKYYSVKAMLCYLNGERQWRLLGAGHLDKEPSDKDKALLVYANLLMNEYIDFGGTYFGFAYIDADEIPELIIFFPQGRIPSYSIYYYNGETADLAATMPSRFDLKYIPKEGIIIQPFFALIGSSETTTIHSYKNGQLKEIRVFDKIGSEYPDYDENGKNANDEEYAYYIDDVEVSYKEYIVEIPEGELILPEENMHEMTAGEIAKI